MAELFLVRSVGPEGFEKLVVLKRVLPHYAQDKRFVLAFLDEAKLVAGFEHPNIAPVYDMGHVDGSYFFTMEYVRGVDVRAILKRCKRNSTRLPIELAVIIARDIASALHCAHERRDANGTLLSLVHRDVSPSNIIVSFEGAPKLIDFGIAKATSSTAKTQTGALKGKVAYMSPEQARGAKIDRRTDVFAIGIVLWEMLAGKRLYKCENDLATLQRIIHQPAPTLRDARSDSPDRLVQIVAKALSLSPDARYQTAQAFQLDLEDFAHEHQLKLSAFALGAYLRDQFADRIRETADDNGAATLTAVTAPAPDADPDDDPEELEAFEHGPAIPSERPAMLDVVDVRASRSRGWWLVALVAAAGMAVATGVALSPRSSGTTSNAAAGPPPLPQVRPPSAPSPALGESHVVPAAAAPVDVMVADEPAVRRAGSHEPVRATKRPHKVAKPSRVVPTAPASKAIEHASSAATEPAPTEPAKKPNVPFDPNAIFPP